MRIGVIGVGSIGRTLIRQYALTDHDIKMVNANDAEKLKKLESETTLDAGDLEGSWRQQPESLVYCTDLSLAQLKKKIFNANREVLPERRELALQFTIKQDPEQWMVWWENCVTNNRIISECNLTA